MAQQAQAVQRQAIEEQGNRHDARDRQLTFGDRWMARARRQASTRGAAPLMCAGCRQHEARYGFRAEDAEPHEERPRTLCFSCFRIELDRRQAVAARLARGWNAEQVSLPLEKTPLEEKLRELTRRRRRAQIAARHALGA